ncbi:MAG: hypothetical protein HY791_28630 [Deltaproteobacteria bacterium]|nr:hypothetical protein [Deltaproteobacteria bacterium]
MGTLALAGLPHSESRCLQDVAHLVGVQTIFAPTIEALAASAELFDLALTDLDRLSFVDAYALSHLPPVIGLALGPVGLPPSARAPSRVVLRRRGWAAEVIEAIGLRGSPAFDALQSGELAGLAMDARRESRDRRVALALLALEGPIAASEAASAIVRSSTERVLLDAVFDLQPRITPDPDALRELVAASDPEVGARALRAAAFEDPEGSRSALIDALGSTSPLLRLEAAEVGASAGHIYGDNDLLARIASLDLETSSRAARSLEALDPTEPRGALRDEIANAISLALREAPDPIARRSAFELLRTAPGGRVVETLLEVAAGGDATRAGLAALLLARRPGRASWGALFALRRPHVDRALLQEAVQSPLANLVVRLAESPSVDSEVRTAALLHVAHRRSARRALSLIEELAQHPELADAIVEASTELGLDGTELLANIAESSADPFVRAEAVAASVASGREELIDRLAHDARLEARIGSASARARRDRHTLASLCPSFATDGEERRSIEAAVLRVGIELGPAGYGLLERLVRSDQIEPSIRSAAASHLRNSFSPKDAELALDDLVLPRSFAPVPAPLRPRRDAELSPHRYAELVEDLVDETPTEATRPAEVPASDGHEPANAERSEAQLAAPAISKTVPVSNEPASLPPGPVAEVSSIPRPFRLIPLEEARQVLASLIAEGQGGLPRIELMARSRRVPDPIRIDALHWLHHQLDRRALLPILKVALLDRSFRVSTAAIGIAGRLGNALLPEIEALAEDPDRAPETRVRAITHLGAKKGKAETAAMCQRLLHDQTLVVQRAALDGLFPSVRLLKGPRLEEALVNLLEQHESTNVKVSAALALGSFGSLKAISRLSHHARGVLAIGRLNDAARTAIERIESRHAK